MKLALLGGTPVRRSFPAARPRLIAAEAAGVASILSRAGDWSRVADDRPLPGVDRLEAEWAREHDARHAIAVSSGTAALTLILRVLALPDGDEVLIPAYGCPAVDVAVLAAGLTPVHVDLDPGRYVISPQAAAAAVTPRTAALIAVHFAGAPAHVDWLARLAERYGLALIEDACLAPGARYADRPVGTWGRAAAFSLGVRKPITAGEGGLVATNDAALAAALRRARNLGMDAGSGDIAEPYGNARLTALQAAAALPQLARLEADRLRREEAAAVVCAALPEGGPLRPLEADPRVTRHSRAQLWLRYDEAAAGVPGARVVEAVQAEGTPLLAGWERPNYCLGMYTARRAATWLRAIESGRAPQDYERTCCPVAERAAFGEAHLLDFSLLDAGPEAARDAAEALIKVSEQLATLRER